jgi:hypothetical protein
VCRNLCDAVSSTVSKASRVDYEDVQAVIDAGTEEVDWVAQELRGADLGDERLDRRLVKTVEHFAQSPIAPINEACGTWASTQASYRLFNNAKASPRAILSPHIQATARRMAAVQGPVLAVQDTVFLNYGKHPKTKEIGPIGKSNAVGERGLVQHNAVAFTTEGVPLGVLSQQTWARKEVPEETRQEKIKRVQGTVTEKKESVKWLVALRETRAHTPPGVKVITVADRESDFFEFIAEAQENKDLFLIRARFDRQLVAEDSAEYASLREALVEQPVLGGMTVQIPSNGKRKARTARVVVRTARVTLKPPPLAGPLEPVRVNALWVTEVNVAAGEDALSWVLLTNLSVRNLEEAIEKIDWYGRRWGIETWHKVLKSGCKVEDCLLETGTRLKRYLALFSIIAVRLMYITCVARARPDAPASEVFSGEEMEALHLRLKKIPPPPERPPTLRTVVRMIGGLGGHLGRKCDGEPGIIVLWRGLTRLYEDVEMLHACRALGRITSS